MFIKPALSVLITLITLVYLASELANSFPFLKVPKPTLQKEPKSHVGIDISHYQSDINWDTLLKNNIAFIFIKATQGESYTDPQFSAHAIAASAKSIPFGYYHFFTPNKDPLKQAQHFLKTIESQQASLRPVVDIEVLNNETSEKLVSGLKQWIRVVERALGCEVIIYTGDNFWHTYLATDFAGKTLWLAEYRDFAPDDKWLIWQRSQSGRLVGLQGRVDLDELRHQTLGLEVLSCKRT